jgi:hypothetical protein
MFTVEQLEFAAAVERFCANEIQREIIGKSLGL